MSAKKDRGRKKGNQGAYIVLGTIAVIAAAVVWLLLSPPAPSPGGFTLPIVGPGGLTGQQLSLSSLQRKVVLLEFMEPWCVHCQNEVPNLKQLYRQYGSSIGIVSISGAYQGATADTTAAFIRDYGTSWTFVFDSAGSVFSSYDVGETPVFIFLKKDGSVSSTLSGEVTLAELTAAIGQAGG